MFRKSTRKTFEERQSTLDARERERIRDELRSYAISEGKKVLRDTFKDIEKQAFSTGGDNVFSGITASSSRRGRSQGNDTGSGLDFGSLGTGLFKLASSLLLSNNRKRITQSSAVESDRSNTENQFYKQSRAQFDASLSSAANKGERNL